MNNIIHHISDELLSKYYQGELDYATSLVIASHISLCDQCRSSLEAIDVIGGAILDDEDVAQIDDDLQDRIMAAISDEPSEQPSMTSFHPYTEPVITALGGQLPKWRTMGGGVKQCLIRREKKSSVRLLWIEAGRPVPEHTHCGNELTLVLQGAFSDKTGKFARGDVEMADESLEHQPIAMEGEPCICLASTSDNLIFKDLLPRALQPIFGI